MSWLINSAAMNIGGHVSLSILVSSVCMPRSGIAGSELPYDPDFILGGSKITADSDCSHEIKTLAPWKEIYVRQHVNAN